jgi:hypothetical protein
MTRGYMTGYLRTADCHPEDSNDVPGDSPIWRNAINGLSTFIPFEESLSLRTYCRIFYELKVDPPKEHGYDSDYAVFTSFMDS